jgi:hypothetical protein
MHVRTVVNSRVLQRLVDGEIGVVELDVLADKRDLDGFTSLSDPFDQLIPIAERRLLHRQAELLADHRVEALRIERTRDEIDVRYVDRRDHRVGVDVGEERDLVADLRRERFLRARHHDVRVDTDAAELVDRVLRRLRLQLAGVLDERNKRHVDIDDVLRPDLAPELTNRLEEREPLDVADRPADLGDHDVGVARLRDRPDTALDLVGDVRDHLDRRAEVLALPLLAEDAVPDRAGGVVRVPREVLVDEALVVADVEIGFRAVLGHEHLAVLERAHRPGIDVEVRIELLDLDLQAPRLQEPAERGGGDALSE